MKVTRNEKEIPHRENSVQETLIIPLLGRLVCSGQFPQLFSDPEAKRPCDLNDLAWMERIDASDGAFPFAGALPAWLTLPIGA